MVPYGTRLPLKFVEFWRYGQTDSCYFVSNFFVEISTSGSTFVEEELRVYHVFCYPNDLQVHGNDYEKNNSHLVEFSE